MIRYYRRDGAPYEEIPGDLNGLHQWSRDFEGDRHVGVARLWWGGRVSTVWMGIDYNFFGGPPLIFETIVFPRKGFPALDCFRYSTEEQAKTGHMAMVRKWSNPFLVLRFLREINGK